MDKLGKGKHYVVYVININNSRKGTSLSLLQHIVSKLCSVINLLNLILVYFCHSYFVIFLRGGANVVCNKHSGIIGI